MPLNGRMEQQSEITLPISAADVTFIQEGAEALTRTAEDKLQDFIDIFDFISYGDGSDETDALVAALSAATTQRKVLRGRPGVSVGFSSPITFDANLQYDGNGMKLVPLRLTSGYAIRMTGTVAANTMGGCIRGLTMRVTPLSTGSLIGLAIGDVAGSVNCVAFYDLELSGFDTNLAFIAGNVFIVQFYRPIILNASTRGISWQAPTNAGENISFYGGSLSNSSNSTNNALALYIDAASSAPDMHFFGTSWSYNDLNGEVNTGTVELYGCHQENSMNSPMWLIKNTASATPSSLLLVGGQMGPGPLGKQLEPAQGRPFFVQYDPGTNVVIEGTTFGSFHAATNVADYVTAIGKQAATGNPQKIKYSPIINNNGTNGVPPDIDVSLNRVLRGLTTGFEGFTQNTATGIAFSVQTSGYGDDNRSRCVTGVGPAPTGGFYQQFSVVPGQYIVAKAAVQLLSVTALNFALERLIFLAADGISLVATVDFQRKYTTPGNTDFRVQYCQYQVPAGAAFMQMQAYVNGLTGTVRFSDEKLWILN